MLFLKRTKAIPSLTDSECSVSGALASRKCVWIFACVKSPLMHLLHTKPFDWTASHRRPSCQVGELTVTLEKLRWTIASGEEPLELQFKGWRISWMPRRLSHMSHLSLKGK